MKVIFLFGGLPHYFNKVLNKINADADIEVVVIAPLGSGVTMGSGVNQTDKGINFRLIRLREYNTWYGKPFFRKFRETINNEKPDAIVSGWPYFLNFIFNPFLLYHIRKNRIKMISKEIPFTVPGWKESFSEFDSRCVNSQKGELIFRSGIAFRALKLMRKYLYSVVFDHAFLYLEKGVEIIHSYGLKKENITVTYNSPDTDELLETIETVKARFPALAKEKYRMVHMGRLVKWKNVHLLIDAVKELKQKYPSVSLAIIGKGEEEENLKNQAKRLNLNDHVKFLGAMYEGEEQTMELLKSEVYVLAGMGGLSINDAMAHSLPVVCSVADGTEKHLVYEGVNGYYFKDSDLSDLVSSIDRTFQSDTRKMGEKSLDIIQSKINIHKVSENYIGGIKKILSSEK